MRDWKHLEWYSGAPLLVPVDLVFFCSEWKLRELRHRWTVGRKCTDALVHVLVACQWPSFLFCPSIFLLPPPLLDLGAHHISDSNCLFIQTRDGNGWVEVRLYFFDEESLDESSIFLSPFLPLLPLSACTFLSALTSCERCVRGHLVSSLFFVHPWIGRRKKQPQTEYTVSDFV